MSTTPAQVTEAHRRLAEKIICSGEEIGKWAVDTAQLIADSEARAVLAWRELCGKAAIERDQLRAQVAQLQKNCTDIYDAGRKTEDQLRAEVERLTRERRIEQMTAEHLAVRAERAEAELAKERARLAWVFKTHPTLTLPALPIDGYEKPTLEDAIDAAMKEDSK